MKNGVPQPIQSIPPSVCRNIGYLFTDIDDTITDRGLLVPASYGMLWVLHEAGIGVVPVTGRPAGWCDHIARMWPVKGIIGENGAFYFTYDRKKKKMKRVYLLSEEERLSGREKLEAIRSRVLREIPRARIAADQEYRLTDLAIDFCEDVVPPLTKNEIEGICSVISEEGAAYKISSIHINCWYGLFDKVACVKRFLQDTEGDSIEGLRETIAYTGDSPNDEPLFKEIRTSIGVANISRFLPDLHYLPAYITEHESALGFCEAMRIILRKRVEGESGEVIVSGEK
ncbi:MAG: HAD-IIB family hydrolase [Spirochaetales bacterium]|nr:HAD-IIB family hydrolase [Spirochaetales bacterium]